VIGNLALFADANAASASLKVGISPLFSTLVVIAATLCILFIVFGGYYYMTSNGNPEKLERAKKTLRNAFIGFVIVLGASGLVAVMQNAYTMKAVRSQQLPDTSISKTMDTGVGAIVNAAVTQFMQGAVESIGNPVVNLLKQFTTATPLMASNGSVFNVWAIIVGITDVLFLLVIALIGFRIMSASVIGLEDVDLRSIAPQIILTFIVANLSIFAIDAIITVSNAMIQALLIGMSNDIIWVALGALITGAGATLNIGVLILLVVAVILGVMLLIYYLERIIVLYVGAVLSPLIVLLWLLPSFRDFAVAAAKTYIITIFVLFVHVTILMLAVSLFAGLVKGEGNAFMTALLGIATLLALLKTSRIMNQLALLSAGNQGLRRLGNTFVRSASHMSSTVKKSNATAATKGAASTASTGTSGTSSSTTARVLSNSGPSKFNQGAASKVLVSRSSQVSVEKAAKAISSKDKLPYEPVVSGGKKSGKVTLTKKNVKGAK
jgi:hypothetical protein